MLNILRFAAAAMSILPLLVQGAVLPDPASPSYCQVIQKIMASTDIESDNTLFKDMPEYRHSKPSPDPLMTYQVVTYDGQRPIMVSCKIKGAAQLRAVYGEESAGEQLYCPDVAKMVQAEAVAELLLDDAKPAAEKALAFVIDDNEPYMTGRDYLADFELSYKAPDGKIHINSPGLFHDYDSWTTWILPEIVEGQSYCHLATVDYMKALASGEMEPGTVVTTADDAPVVPQ